MIKNLFSSMTSRIFLILVGGSLLSAAIVMAFAQHDRQELATQFKAQHAADRVRQVLLTLNTSPVESRSAFSDISEKSGIRVSFSNETSSKEDTQSSVFLTNFNTAVKRVLKADSEFATEEHWGEYCPLHFDGRGRESNIQHCATVLTALNDGSFVKIDVALREGPPPPIFHGDLIFIASFFLATIAILSLIVARFSSQPLRELASAAKSLGNNIEQPALLVTKGSTEVREASIAFNTMQNSIRDHIQERTYMLAAIAHDLQTPLTRLRLRLEKVTDVELKNSLVNDLTNTQDMIRQGLEYAQFMHADEPFELIDLDSLLTAIYHDAIDAGAAVTLTGKIGKPVFASPHAIRRCINNLVDNATKYGNFANIHTRRENGKAIITISDGGPGIPEDQLETVFHPFKRLESSRSRNSGGTGLGLTIARIIASRHQGTISLKNIQAGGLGLMVILELPAPYGH